MSSDMFNELSFHHHGTSAQMFIYLIQIVFDVQYIYSQIQINRNVVDP